MLSSFSLNLAAFTIVKDSVVLESFIKYLAIFL